MRPRAAVEIHLVEIGDFQFAAFGRLECGGEVGRGPVVIQLFEGAPNVEGGA